MSTKYHEIREHLWDVNRQSLKKGFRALKMQDPRRADFKREDILDIDFNGVELLLRLKDGRFWQGVSEDLRPHELLVLSEWAEVKAVEAEHGLSGRRKASIGKYDASKTSSSEGPENYGSVYLAEGESGWVEVVGENRVRIANIPYDGRYNIDDVVQVDVQSMRKNPRQVLQGTIEERPYPVRTILMYPKVSDFKKISAMVKKLGGKMEGAIGPSKGRPGFLSLAAKSEKDVLKIVRDLEIPQEVENGWKPNFL